MKVAYIAHPVSGHVKANLEKIASIARKINMSESEVVPFVPYYMDCVVLRDENSTQRERGIKNNRHLLESGVVDELRLYGHKLSKGMIEEIRIALKKKIPIIVSSRALIRPYNDFIVSTGGSSPKLLKY